MSQYTTGELASAANVSVRTVQYYDSRGILIPSDWSEGGRRLYSEEDLNKLRMICYLRELDFSIPQIKEIIQDQHAESTLASLLDIHITSLETAAKLQEEKIKQLQFLRKTLQQDTNFTLNQLPDISLTMKHQLTWRHFAGKQVLKLLLVVTVFLSMIWIAKTKEMSWLAWPAAILYLGGLGYLIWNYYQQVLYLCPVCHKTFKPEPKAFLLARHTPRTRKLPCPHCQHTSYCVEVVENSTKH
ncbi:MerR family transcriptional regulator [Streptococcus caprae]|uniref:MerR family transcriptional regulator n=1 Tax=Streptococcus caprae TaxID=1640501 RepID=A0ABV8CST1_9STRE